MDFQTMITNTVKAQRADRFKTSTQLTLGELILKLEPIADHQKEVIEKYKEEAEVVFDFEYLVPTTLESWRGSYDELALGWTYSGYAPDGCPDKNNSEKQKVSKFLEHLKSAIGKEFTGWKGGEFIMGKNTPVWVANLGNSGETGIVNVIDDEHTVILVTQICEF